jgi:hypothetical protein
MSGQAPNATRFMLSDEFGSNPRELTPHPEVRAKRASKGDGLLSALSKSSRFETAAGQPRPSMGALSELPGHWLVIRVR